MQETLEEIDRTKEKLKDAQKKKRKEPYREHEETPETIETIRKTKENPIYTYGGQ